MHFETPEHIAAELERFIRNQFQVPASDELFTRDVNLWEAGYVDSVGVAEVIAFLEDTFEVEVPADALFDPDFVHIDGIARIVHGLRVERRADVSSSRQASDTGVWGAR